MKRILLSAVLALTMLASAQDITITFMGGAGAGAGVELERELAAAYSEMTDGVTIEHISGPESATDRIGLYLQFFEAQSGEVDVFMIDVIWPGDLAEHLVNLYDHGVSEDFIADFFPAIVGNNTVDGELVGIPWYTDAGLLYYRQDLLEEYGYDGPPETWQELTDMAQTIMDGERAEGNEDFYGFVWQGNAYEGLTCNVLEWIAANNGGQMVEPDGVITVNNANATEILELAAGWVGSISPSGVTGFQEEDARRMWEAGNVAFMRNWPYAYTLGNDPDSSEIAGLFDVTTLPAGSADGGSSAATLGGWQLGVSAYSEHPDEAAAFAQFLTSYEQQLRFAIEGSLLPTIEAVYEDSELLESQVGWFNDLLPVFQNAVARPSTITAPQYAQVSRAIFSATHDVLTGQEDAETALAILELDLEAITGFPTGSP